MLEGSIWIVNDRGAQEHICCSAEEFWRSSFDTALVGDKEGFSVDGLFVGNFEGMFDGLEVGLRVIGEALGSLDGSALDEIDGWIDGRELAVTVGGIDDWLDNVMKVDELFDGCCDIDGLIDGEWLDDTVGFIDGATC